MSIVAHFESVSARRTDELAIVDRKQAWTYGVLNERANQIARLLRQLGVRADAPVPVCLERSAEAIAALLGILKAGAAYVPLDPDWPSERLGHALIDSKAKVLVANEAALANMPAFQLSMLRLVDSEDPRPLTGLPTTNLGLPEHPKQLAYIAYTSGSTGKPKGVMVDREAVVSLVKDADYVEFNERLCIAQASNTAFDATTFEIWGALLNGARLCIVDKNTLLSPPEFDALVTSAGIDTLFITTALFNQYSVHGGPTLARLRHLLFGGEKVDVGAARRVLTRHRPTRLLHVYGPTESTTFSSWHEILHVAESDRTVPIGRAVSGRSLYVLDARMAPVPGGVVGELYIGGMGNARGYLNDPRLTASRFVANPFEPGSRLYRTGDLVRWSANANLEFVGRADEQVKIRGFRIEPGEVAAAILSLGLAEHAVVVARDWRGTKMLVAYLAGAENRVDRSELRGRLAARLPDYMVPAAFVALDMLPLNSNGKVDRDRLPEPTEADLPAGQGDPPASVMERALAQVWSRVLGCDSVSRQDNFFERGGDSLLALRLKAEAERQGITFDLASLFDHQTLAELALVTRALPADAAVEQSRAFELVAEADRRLMPDGVQDAYPLSQLQMGMLFHTDYRKDSTYYHIVVSHLMTVPFDPGVLRHVLDGLADRHEILRTSVDLESFSEPLQLVHARVTIPLASYDFRSLTQERQKQEFQDWLKQEVRRRYQRTTAPWFRVSVHRIKDDQMMLSLTFHHAILDGWSDATLMTELVQEYRACLTGISALSAPPLARFRDFIALERSAMNSEASRQFWLDRLADFEANPLQLAVPAAPLDEAGEGVQRVPIPIGEDVGARVEDVAHRLGAPVKSLLLAVHAYVLGVVTGSHDVLTGLISNGRPEIADGDRVLGLFLNTLPFRVRIQHGAAWSDLIRAVTDAERECLPHRRYPLPEILRHAGNRARFQTAFNYTNFHVYTQLGDFQRNFTVTGGMGDTSIGMLVDFSLVQDRVIGVLSGHRSLFGKDALATIARLYARVLSAVVEAPSGKMAQLALLDEGDQQRILGSWNRTHQSIRPATVPALFEAQAERFPNRAAIIFRGTTLTFAELNRRANQLAHHLVRSGVAIEDIVGLALPRCPEMVVSVLAVLKAGAAYLPLDPEYPAERLALMLEDASPRMVITLGGLTSRIGGSGVTLLLDDPATSARVGHESDANVARPGLTPANAAYVIYTSGSTGRPKAVLGTHDGAQNRLWWFSQRFPYPAEKPALAKSTMNFIDGSTELLTPLLDGRSIVLADNEESRSPQLLAGLIKKHSVGCVTLVPDLLSSILDHAEADDLRRCELWVSSGDVLTDQLAERFRRTLPSATLLNFYGATEASGDSTFAEGGQGRGVVGHPIWNTETYVLDEALRPVPEGVTGEIYIGGIGLARGYLRRASLSATRFVANPFRGKGERMYRTGDLGRWRHDGALEFLGRRDNQVKVNGIRIELGEVEAALRQLPTIARAAAVIRESAQGSKQIVAYFVPQDPARAIEPHEVQLHLTRLLPAYMVPSAYVCLAAMPATPNGKLDRARLPSPTEAALAAAEYRPPMSESEIKLARLWQEVLRVSRVGMDDDFFALGGHSLSAVTLAARISKAFGVNLPVSALYAHRTLQQLAQHLAVPAQHAGSEVIVFRRRPDQSRSLFLIPPGSGDCACYQDLVASIPPDIAVMGFERPELASGSLPMFGSIRELASQYAQAIRERQPRGPYYLAGWSLGGLIAYEVAAQLQSAGAEIALLGIIDTHLPDEQARALLGATALQDLDWSNGSKVEEIFRKLWDGGAGPGPEAVALLGPDERMQIYRRMHVSHMLAAMAFVPGAQVDRICYIAARDLRSEQRIRQFEKLAGREFSTHIIDADHYSIIRAPAVEQVVKSISPVFRGLT